MTTFGQVYIPPQDSFSADGIWDDVDRNSKPQGDPDSGYRSAFSCLDGAGETSEASPQIIYKPDHGTVSPSHVDSHSAKDSAQISGQDASLLQVALQQRGSPAARDLANLVAEEGDTPVLPITPAPKLASSGSDDGPTTASQVDPANPVVAEGDMASLLVAPDLKPAAGDVGDELAAAPKSDQAGLVNAEDVMEGGTETVFSTPGPKPAPDEALVTAPESDRDSPTAEVRRVEAETSAAGFVGETSVGDPLKSQDYMSIERISSNRPQQGLIGDQASVAVLVSVHDNAHLRRDGSLDLTDSGLLSAPRLGAPASPTLRMDTSTCLESSSRASSEQPQSGNKAGEVEIQLPSAAEECNGGGITANVLVDAGESPVKPGEEVFGQGTRESPIDVDKDEGTTTDGENRSTIAQVQEAAAVSSVCENAPFSRAKAKYRLKRKLSTQDEPAESPPSTKLRAKKRPDYTDWTPERIKREIVDLWEEADQLDSKFDKKLNKVRKRFAMHFDQIREKQKNLQDRLEAQGYLDL